MQSVNLETNYRTVAQFYKNTELDKVDNVSIVNASLDQVSDLDNPYLSMPLQKNLRTITTV
jgi:hypothetical protein